jgi:hypothetical protein
MKSKSGEDLKVGDKIVYVTTSYHWPFMRFGEITKITEGRLEQRFDYRKQPYHYHIPGKIEVLDTKGKKRFTRGHLVYKLEEVNKMFEEVK